MGGNFNNPLNIDTQGRIAPTGPLTREKGENGTGLVFFVVQERGGGSGAACSGTLAAPDLTGNWWTASAGAIHQGQFLPGKAIVTALVTGELNGTTTVFKWGGEIDVK
jgi:hypothetical protein